jgi:uncharacterized protein
MILKKICTMNADDPAHDISHLKRVLENGMMLCKHFDVDQSVVTAACLLHDFVNTPKDSKDRANASLLSADAAVAFLKENFPDECASGTFLDQVHAAIVTHSYSLGKVPTTLEGMIVQDADRLDALGAIGIMRCFSVGASMKCQFYHPTDPFHTSRVFADDRKYSVDHFHTKLFRLPEFLNTMPAKIEAERRIRFMRDFLHQLKTEIAPRDPAPAT